MSGGGLQRYGDPDEIGARQWREAHIDPDKLRAWGSRTGRPVPPRAIPAELRQAYLDECADEIILPGHPTRDEAHAALPLMARPFVAWLGSVQVTYGPCPLCGKPAATEPGKPLPPCMYCETPPAGRARRRPGSRPAASA